MTGGQRGFTLLELLIAIALLVLLTGMLYGGLDLASRRYQGQSHRLDRSAQVALVQNFLRAQISDARALPAPGGGKAIQFDGRPDGISFVSRGPASANVGGLAQLTVAYAPGTSGTSGTLSVHWQPLAPTVAPRDSILLAKVRRVEFSYYGAPTPGDAPAWHTSWQSLPILPSLVRLSLEFADGEIMPTLVIAIETKSSSAGGLAAQR